MFFRGALAKLSRCALVFAALLSGFSLAGAEKPAPRRPLPGVGYARFLDIFSPLRTEHAALSPDGKLLAYSYREGTELSVVVVDVDRPKIALTRVRVGNDRLSTQMMRKVPGDETARLLFLGWCGPRRVAIKTNSVAVFGLPSSSLESTTWISAPGFLLAFDADGGNARLLATPRDFAVSVHGSPLLPRKFEMVGTDPEQADAVLIELPKVERGGSSPRETRQVDTVTGKIRLISDTDAARKRAALQDRKQTAEVGFRSALTELRSAIPLHDIDVQGSDTAGNRFLTRVQSNSNPGSFHVFDRAAQRSYDFVRCAPSVDTTRIAQSIPFECRGANGAVIHGTLTLPRQARLRPFPLLVTYAPPNSSNELQRYRFKPELLAFAEMGFAVLQLEDIGVPRASRSNPNPKVEDAHLANISVALEAAAERFPLSRKTVGWFSDYTTADFAFRLLLREPERFRAGIVMEPRVPEDWRAPRPAKGVDRHDAPPLLVFASRASPRQIAATLRPAHTASRAYLVAREYAADYRRGGASSDFETLSDAFDLGLPQARAAVFVQMENFLNVALYRYVVELGPLREIEDAPTDSPAPAPIRLVPAP